MCLNVYIDELQILLSSVNGMFKNPSVFKAILRVSIQIQTLCVISLHPSENSRYVIEIYIRVY